MIQNIQNRAKICSVSGNEDALLKKIEQELLLFCDKIEYANDCLLVKKIGIGNKKKKILACVGSDFPGFITLATDKKYAYLAKNTDFAVETAKIGRVVDEEGKRYFLKKSKEEPTFYYVSKGKLALGDSLGLDYRFTVNNDKITGFGIGHHALIDQFISLAKGAYQNDIIFAFTVNSLSSACRENQLIRKISPDEILLCGIKDSDSTAPILLYRDGKATLNHKTNRTFAEQLKNEAVSFDISLSATALTKAEKVYAENSLPIISLALPVEKVGKSEESLSLQGVENFSKVLTTYLNYV